MHLNTSDDVVVLNVTEAEILLTDSDGSLHIELLLSMLATIYNLLSVTVVMVGFEDDFRTILEGNNLTTCASFRNVSLDRDVPIQFNLQSITATSK